MRAATPLIPLFAALATLACGPSGSVQANPLSSPQQARTGVETVNGTVKGVLRQVGNAPHIEVVVSGESAAFGKGDYHLIGPRAEELARQPQGPITVKGKLRRIPMRLAGSSGKTRIRMDVDVSEYAR